MIIPSKKMILITGTPRCGTHYTAALLQALGLRVLHEAVDTDGAVSWKHLGEGTFSVPKRNRVSEITDPGFTTIIHQVRHPLKSISSMQTLRDCTWEFMARHIELDMNAPVAERGMQCWIGWNSLAETRAEWTYQIENLSEAFPELLSRLNLPPQSIPKLSHESRESRVQRFSKIGWENLLHANEKLAHQTADLARKYGYEIENISHLEKVPPPEPPSKPSRLRRALNTFLRD